MSLVPKEFLDGGGTRGFFDLLHCQDEIRRIQRQRQAIFDALLKLPHVVKQKGGTGGWQVFFGASPYYAFRRRSDARVCARALQGEILKALAGVR